MIDLDVLLLRSESPDPPHGIWVPKPDVLALVRAVRAALAVDLGAIYDDGDEELRAALAPFRKETA